MFKLLFYRILLFYYTKKLNLNIKHKKAYFKTFGAYAETSKCCDGIIYVSIHFLNDPRNGYEEIKGLILHELAHIIDKCENGHNKKWENIAYKIGMKNKYRFCRFKVKSEFIRYYLICPKGCKIERYRKSKKRHRCKKHNFSMILKLNKKFKF